MADDACNAVKTDLEAGSYTYYTDNFPIYIDIEGKFEGGNTYIYLKNGRRNPIQTVSGNILITPRSCTLQIVSTDPENRDDLYDDVVDILTSTTRGYLIKRGNDVPFDDEHYSITIEVSMLL